MKKEQAPLPLAELVLVITLGHQGLVLGGWTGVRPGPRLVVQVGMVCCDGPVRELDVMEAASEGKAICTEWEFAGGLGVEPPLVTRGLDCRAPPVNLCCICEDSFLDRLHSPGLVEFRA